MHFALSRPALTLATAGLALLSCLPIVSRIGAEFLPRVDEGDLLYMPTTLPGVSPDEAALQLFWQDHAMSQFGEVASVFGKVGRADTGTDPAPYSMAETTIRLRPRSEWPKVARARWYSRWAPEPLRRMLRHVWPDLTPRTTAELVDELDKAVRLPGWTARLDRAGARAHGHDGDRRAHARRHPHRRRPIRSGSTPLGTALRALVERHARARAAPSSNRWAARPGSTSTPTRRRCAALRRRPGGGARRWPIC